MMESIKNGFLLKKNPKFEIFDAAMLSDAPGARTSLLRRWPGADLLRCVALPPRRLNGVHVRLRPSHIPRPHRAGGPESQGHLR